MRLPTKLLFLVSFLAAQTVVAQVFIPYAHWACKDYEQEITSTGVDFAGGTFSNTNVSGNSVVLSVGQTSGTYTSRVYDIFGGCAPLQSWQKFQWKTGNPFGKEMVGSSETVVDYTNITAGLTTGVQEAFRFHGTIGNIASGTTLTATIGANGIAGDGGGTTLKYAAGKLGTAISLDGTNDFIEVPYTQTAVSDYSISVWFKTVTAGNGVLVQNRGSGAGQSLTLGIGNNPGGCVAGRISFGLDSNTVYYGQCTNTTYNDGSWHHVVGVWDGTSGAAVAANQFTIYVDGQAVASTAVVAGTAPNAPLTGLSNTKFGRHDTWAVNYAGLMDETVIWNRPLTATEVLQLYQRGGNNVRFQIKTCDTTTCGDVATWKGPDNTASTYFSELNNNIDQAGGTGSVFTTFPAMLFANFPSLVVDTKRYFQYRATLTTDVSTIQPDFNFTSIHHGCAANTVNFTANGTFVLPKLCTQMTVTASGGGGATGRKVGGGNRGTAGNGGRVTKTFTGLTPLTSFTITIGQGGTCAQVAGTGGYNGGAGGATNTVGASGDGTLGLGGAGGAPGSGGFAGGLGKFGGGGGGGGDAANTGGAGGGGASTVRLGSTDYVVAGGGGGSGGVQSNNAGNGGHACGGAASGDATIGAVGTAGSGTSAGGGGGGGGCYCIGGCATTGTNGGAGGDTSGVACQASNDGAAGSVTIIYQ